MQWNNETIICLAIDDEESLMQLLKEMAIDNDVTAIGFYEPDINNQLTAIAAYGLGVSRYTSELNLTLKQKEVMQND